MELIYIEQDNAGAMTEITDMGPKTVIPILQLSIRPSLEPHCYQRHHLSK